MKYAYHSLLPTYLQDILMTAKNKNDAIQEVYEMMPQKFHDATTVESRKFYHEPTRGTPNSGFIISITFGLNSK